MLLVKDIILQKPKLTLKNKAEKKEANHLSTGDCMNIKQGQEKNLFCFKACRVTMILDQLDAKLGGKQVVCEVKVLNN